MMRLVVNKNYEKELVENEYHLATAMLAMKATHLFIASHRWESVHIAIEDIIPVGYLRCLPLVSDNIKVSLPNVVTDHTMTLLTEIYPDRAGKIRRAYMCGGSLEEVLDGCLVQLS